MSVYIQFSPFVIAYEQQGGAGDLFYPGFSQTASGCWGPILPRVLTNSKGVLGTYSTPGSHGHSDNDVDDNDIMIIVDEIIIIEK